MNTLRNVMWYLTEADDEDEVPLDKPVKRLKRNPDEDEEVGPPSMYQNAAKPLPSVSFEDTDIAIRDAKTTMALLEAGYRDPSTLPLFVYGDTGVGKSTTIFLFAKECARRENRKLVAYSNMNDEYIKEVCEGKKGRRRDADTGEIIEESLDEIFLFADLRVGDLETENILGIPDIDKSNKVGHQVNVIPAFSRMVTHPDTHGLILFDEYNLCKDHVLGAMMQVTLDRVIGQRKLSDRIQMVAAGNIGAKYAGKVNTLSDAQAARFRNVVFQITAEEWKSVAKRIGVNRWMIDFAMIRPEENLFGTVAEAQDGNKPVNPRSLTKASFEVNKIENHYKQLTLEGTPLPSNYSGNIYQDILAIGLESMGKTYANRLIDWLYKVHKFRWAEVVEHAKNKRYRTKANGTAEIHFDTDTKVAHTRYIIDKILERFEYARNHGDEAEKTRLLNKLRDQFYYIIGGVDDEQMAQILTNIADVVKNSHGKSDASPEAAAGAANWHMLMQPIWVRFKNEDPENFAKFVKYMDGIKNQKKE